MSDFISSNCKLKEFTVELLKGSSGFSCGESDLDEFFIKMLKHTEQLSWEKLIVLY